MRKVIIIVGSIFVVLLIMIGVLVFNNPFLSIELKGKKKSVIEVNTKYKDPEVKALLLNKNISTNIKIKSNLNTRKLGKYKITYLVKYLKTVKKVSRQVEVVDTTKPVIELIGDDLITLNKGDKYQEPGVKVSDNYNNDLNDKVEIISNVDTNIVGEYEITYKVKDSSNNEVSIKRRVVVKEGLKNNKYVMNDSGVQVTNDTVAPTYIKGILLVNKKYGLPASFGGGVDQIALANLHTLQSDALALGYSIPTLSAYRSYQTQATLYNNYYKRDGAEADTYSARPGHSEHQTGLAFDVGQMEYNYGETEAGRWLAENCASYGFIIRYPKGKESITGYVYEPWHIRYVGVAVAKEIMDKNITLEEYLGV